MTLPDRLAWTEEGTELVAPGVHRIPLPLPTDGLRAVNVYAIEAADGLVLIDSGWALANSRDQLVRSLARIGAGLPDVRRFLVTHLHRDHYTQALAIRRELGTHVALGSGERPSIEKILAPRFGGLPAQVAQLRLAGADAVVRELTELAGRLSTWAPERCGPSPPPATPAGTWCSPMRPPGCYSPAITCCPTSRRPSDSRRSRGHCRSAPTWNH
jgi:hypothetical protein